MIPRNTVGNEHQNFNTDPKNPTKILVAEPNWYDIFGVDMEVAGDFR